MAFPYFEILDIELVGSRVTVNPPPTDTDLDVLVLVDNSRNFIHYSLKEFYLRDAKELYPDTKFVSLRKGDLNIIVTENPSFFNKFCLANRLAKQANFTCKENRVQLHNYVINDDTNVDPTIISYVDMLLVDLEKGRIT